MTCYSDATNPYFTSSTGSVEMCSTLADENPRFSV